MSNEKGSIKQEPLSVVGIDKSSGWEDMAHELVGDLSERK